MGAYIGLLGIVGAARDTVWANDISFRETVYNTDFVSAGVGGMRNAASASLSITGIKGTVRRAYLYWHGPMNSDFPLANATIRMDNQTITGVHIGTSDDNCWGFDNSQAYRADITTQVIARRNASYILSQFVKQGTNINANGASILVFFDDGNGSNNRDIVIFEGNDSNAPNGFDLLGWNAVLPGVVYSSGTAYLQVHVSDGQIYQDDSFVLNGAVLRGRGSIFQGTSVPSGNNGPNGYGNLWDIKTWDITRYLALGANNLLLTHGYIQRDCISLVVAAFNLPASSAPPSPPVSTNTPPTVTGPAEITVNSPAAMVIEAEARDNDGDSLDYTISVGGENMQTGSVPEGNPQTLGKLSLTNAFPAGVHTVVFTVSDGRTNASHTATVRVIDNTPPVLVATNLVVPSDPGKTTAVVNYVVKATDDFPGHVAVVSFPPPGGQFPIGVTLVTVTAADLSGNSAQATFTITVTDALAPTILCPPGVIQFTDPETNNAVVIYQVNATDNLPGVAVACVPPSGTSFPVGTSTVNCTATDAAGNKAYCSFAVTINVALPVNHPPTVVGETNIIYNSNAPVVVSATAMDIDGDALAYTIRIDGEIVQSGVVSPATPIVPANPQITIGTLSVTNAFAMGTHAVVFEVSDGKEVVSFTTTVRVFDDTPPDIDVPPNIIVPVDLGLHVAVVNHRVTVRDNFPGPIDLVVLPPSGSAFEIGTTTVTIVATDSSGNTARATFTVTVVDNVPPSITCPPNVVRFTDPGTNVAVVTYAADASDNLPGATVACVPPSGSVFPIGTSTVTCTVRDAAGNQESCAFAVTINPKPVDNVPPSILCPPDIIRFNDTGTNVAMVYYTVNATDNLPGVTITCTPPSGSVFPVGTSQVTCVARDAAGNTATCVFNVTIKDQPPIVAVPTNVVVGADAGQCSAVVNYTVTVQDNSPGWSLVCVPPSGSLFPSGTTTVVCTVTDAAGNKATNSFTVTVEDREKPVLQLPADITVTITNQISAIVNYVATAIDNCSGATVVTVPASGSSFPLGTTIVQATATDAAGNVTTGTFRVTVSRNNGGGDTEPPVIVSITPSTNCLWPPDHKMVTVTFAVQAADNSGKAVTAEIISITSNESENDLGDGNTEHDWLITGPLRAQLRAERSGLGSDRIYTIVIRVTDKSGNSTTGVTTVCVPHDMSEKVQIMPASARMAKVMKPAPVKLVRVVPAKAKPVKKH